MNWSSWSDFFHMGGNGAFVWGAFGVAAATMVIELWQLNLRRSKAMLEATSLQDIDRETQA